MSEPLLAVEKLEVVYQRAITAVQGVSLTVPQGRIIVSGAPPPHSRRARAVA
jgi:ABC-type branched-subunit amino acid transport system ATPase component